MKTNRIFAILFAIVMTTCLAVPVSAQEENTVTLRIEGINENLYYGEVALTDEATVADVIISADEASDKITVVGADAGYITDINGELAGTFGGWDGWFYRVNGTEPAVGIGDCAIKAGDEITLCYSDAYGVGMQYPVVDAADIANGVISFKSTDITYDENYNAVTAVNPVAGMTVVFDEAEYVTDENGRITIAAEILTPGDHRISVSKSAENGVPLVLRLAPDAVVTVPEPTPDEAPAPDDESAAGGGSMIMVLLIMAVIVVTSVVTAVKKRK